MRFFKIFLLIILGSVVFICGCARKGEKVIKIALIGPLTGDIAAMGQGMKNAAELAIMEVNEKKIIPNVKFELFPVDDRADPKEAVSGANRIVSEPNVVGVVGHLNSHCSIPAARVYNKHNLIMISPASTNPKLTLQQLEENWRGKRNVFRVCTTDDVQGSFAADLLYNKLKIKNVAVIHDKTTYGQGLAEEFKKKFIKNGGVVVCFEGISLGDKDFKALLTKIKALKPQCIYYGGMYTEGGLISKQAKELGLKIPLVGGDGIFTNEFIKIAGSHSEGDIATMIGVPVEKLPGAGEFVEKYKKFFPKFDMQPYDSYTYDATKIIIEAVKNVGEDREKIIDYVRTHKFKGIIGETSFDEKGDTLNKIITPYIVKGGKFVVLE